MSNVPFDRPICGPMRFDHTSVPPCKINLPPVLSDLAPLAASCLLNRAVELSGANAGRMSAMNHIFINNFQNDNYPGMVDLALRLAARESQKQNQPHAVKSYVDKGVTEALVFLSSSLLATTPEMQHVTDSRTVQAAQQNHVIFQRLKVELANLNLSFYNQQLQQQTYFPTGNTNMSTAPIFSNYSHSYASAHQQEQPSPLGTFGSQWAKPQPESFQPPQPIPQNDSLKQQSWFNNNEITKQTQVVQQAIPIVDYRQPEIIKPLNVLVKQHTVTCNGENEMDINNHALPYFGSVELIDLSARRSDLQLESLQLSREGRRGENCSGPVLLERAILIESNLDSAIFTASVSKAHNLHSGRQNQIYRQFLHIVTPVACSEEARLAMGVFKQAKTLGQLPELFRSFLKVIRDPTNPQENEQQALNFYAYLDRKLCEAVNEFLKYNLRFEVRIDSFAEDFSGLDKYLRETRGDASAQALVAWSSRFFDQLRDGYTKDADDFLQSFFTEGSKAVVGYFPTFQSITLLSLTSKELGYKTEDCGLLIDPKVTGVLDSITQGLYRNKKDLNLLTSRDWLVTSDDCRYRVAEDAMNTGKFYMFASKN